MKLSQLKQGQNARILKISTQGELKKRLIDLGIMVGEKISFQAVAPLGDPILYKVKSTSIAIRHSDACKIDIEILKESL